MTLRLTTNDTAPALSGTVNANLTGASAVVNVKRADGTTFTRAAVIDAPLTGAWHAALQGTDLTVSGTYWLELQVTYSDATIQTFAYGTDNQPVTFVVRQQIA